VLYNRVLRKLYGPSRKAVTGGQRKLHKKELYSSPCVIRMLKSRRKRYVGHVACRNGTRNAYTVLETKTEPKRTLLKQRCR
jgi:hypothetical protein